MLMSNFIAAAIVIFAIFFATWLVFAIIDDASIVDLIWGAAFGVVAAVLYLRLAVKTDYLLILAALPIIWSIRYTVFIWRRNFGHGEDERYTIFRNKVAAQGKSWPLAVLKTVTAFQSVSAYVICLPLIVGLAAPESVSMNLWAWLGVLLWLVGMVFETVADWQLNAFKQKNQDYQGAYEAKPLLTTGLWRYSRHPNYFGNACIWWGIAIVALLAPYGWIGLIGAAYMNFVLVFVTGKANNESKMGARKAYQDYVEKTSGFIPMPPKT